MRRIVLMAVVLAFSVSATAQPKAANMTHGVKLLMHFKDMGGGGDAEFVMRFSTLDLCKSVRRAIWSQLQDANGDLGDCAALEVKGTPEHG